MGSAPKPMDRRLTIDEYEQLPLEEKRALG
jgi:hypothetical protein